MQDNRASAAFTADGQDPRAPNYLDRAFSESDTHFDRVRELVRSTKSAACDALMQDATLVEPLLVYLKLHYQQQQQQDWSVFYEWCSWLLFCGNPEQRTAELKAAV
jgi:hypothetical protein